MRRNRRDLDSLAISLNTFAVFAGIFVSDMADYLQLCRFYIDLFRDFFSYLFKAGSATTDFLAFIDVVDHIDCRKML